jgi:hypothetical protein
MDLTREYIALAENTVSEVRRHILLWHVARAWGRYKNPPTRFRIHAPGTKHALSLPLRFDPVGVVSESDKKVLLQLHQRYGPAVVSLQRVSTSLPLSADDPVEPEQLAYVTCARTLLDLGDVFQRVHVGSMFSHYTPAWVYDSLLVPFLSPKECRARFDMVCYGCLEGMDWTNVAAAGGSVSACLTPQHYIKSQAALEAYISMDVDLFMFSPEALDTTLEHFKHKFPGVFFGFSRGVVVVCIRDIPRVFQLILVDSDFTSLITRFDLDFCQVILTESRVFLTPACIRAHATRVCVATPHVLPCRQHKARQKGFGLYMAGDAVVHRRTFWDQARGYVPEMGHTDEQIRFGMMLNLRCKDVTSDVDHIMNVFNTTDMRNGPEYIPRATTRYNYTGTSFLTCPGTIEEMIRTLPDTLPDGIVGYTLPFTLVFPKYLWVYAGDCDSVVLRTSSECAPGRDDLLQFTDRMQDLFNEMYGDDACTYGFGDKHLLRVSVTPSSRILDVATRTIVDPGDIQITHDVCICTAMQCSTILMGADWWSPIFVCQEVDVFPRELYAIPPCLENIH